MRLLFIFLILFFVVNQPFAQQFKLDERKTELNWTGKAAFNSYSLSGTIQAKSGTLEMTDNGITAATFVVDMPTIDAEIAQLVKHLRSKDFFQVKKYPETTFVLTKPIDWTAKKAYGDLTIKNKTQPVVLTLSSIKKTGAGLEINGSATIDRTAFGIYYNSPNYFDKLKENAIADAFELNFKLAFR